MDKQAFKQRMQNLKSYRENNPGKGYWDWRNSLPDNLKYTDDTEYNMRGAYESGAQPILENDGFYHLPTRNPQTGEILKTSLHPTFWKGLAEDAKIGYNTYFVGDKVYTKSKEEGPINVYADGGEVGRNRDTSINNNMLKQLESSLKKTKDIKGDYFRLGTEQKAYMNQLRTRMYNDKAIDSLEEPVSTTLIKKYMDSLDDKDSIKRAYKQHKSLSAYTKWFNSIPQWN